MKLKKKALIITCLVTTSLILGTVMYASAGGISMVRADETEHVGNHYTELAPTATSSGVKEYWVCCECHKHFLTKPATGTWTDAGTAALINDPTDDRYLPQLYNYTVGDASRWTITKNALGNDKFVANSTETQMLMFNYETFSGGTIELDMTYKTTTATYNVASGIVFGASTLAAEHNTGSWACAGMDPWYDFVTFSKDSGDFRWEDKNKVGGIFTDVNKTYHIAFSWDPVAKLIHYFIDDAYVCTAPITRPLSGQYLGIYSDTQGTIFENIEISSSIYHPEFLASQGTMANWEISNDKKTITAKATGKALMMPQYDISESCYVEFDMNVPNDSTYAYSASGILLCGDQAAPSVSFGSYIVVGRDWWGGFDAFQMINGAFSWKDGNKIANAMPSYNTTYHIKLYVNLETKNIQYFWNDDTTHGAAYDFDMPVAHFGIYDDGLFTISNISVHK